MTDGPRTSMTTPPTQPLETSSASAPGRRPAALAAVLLVAGALAAALAGCGDGADGGDGAPRVGGTAMVAFPGGPRAANPLTAPDAYSDAMNRWLLFLPLLQLGAELELEGRLAESWSVDGDSVVTFHLRRDVTWSDGRPTTAGDAAFALERALDPETAFPNRQHIAHWTGVEAVDSFTLRVSFGPVREPLYGFTLVPALPRHVLEGVPAAELARAPFNLAPVTNGPFRVAEARPGERWVFEADTTFPEPLGGRPRLDRLVWRVIPESAAQEVELRAGEADAVVGVRPESYAGLVSSESLQGYERPTLNYTAVAWNGRRPHLSDPAVRTALTLAMDRRAVLDGLRHGHGTLATGPVPPSHWAHDPSLEPLPHDPEEAAALLEGAGWTDRDGDGVVENGDGDPLRISLLIPAGSDFNRDLAQVIQSDLAEVGVEVRIVALEFGTLVGRITGEARDFDAVILGLDADLRLDLRSLFHGEALAGPFQLAGTRDAALDSTLDALETAGPGGRDREEVRQLWHRAQARIAELQPWSYVYYTTELIAARERLHGLDPDLRGVLPTAPEWWVEEEAAGAEAAGEPDAGR